MCIVSPQTGSSNNYKNFTRLWNFFFFFHKQFMDHKFSHKQFTYHELTQDRPLYLLVRIYHSKFKVYILSYKIFINKSITKHMY